MYTLFIRESELESKVTEVDVLKLAVEQLNGMSAGAPKGKSNEDYGDGWDCEDDRTYSLKCLYCELID